MVWKTFCTCARERQLDWKVNLGLRGLGTMSSLQESLDELAGEQPRHHGCAAPFLRSSKSCRRHRLTGKELPCQRSWKTDSELWLICSGVRRVLINTPSSHKCHRRSGFKKVAGHFGLVLFYHYFLFVFMGKPGIWVGKLCSPWCPDVVTGFSGFEVRIQVGVVFWQCTILEIKMQLSN